MEYSENYYLCRHCALIVSILANPKVARKEGWATPLTEKDIAELERLLEKKIAQRDAGW